MNRGGGISSACDPHGLAALAVLRQAVAPISTLRWVWDDPVEWAKSKREMAIPRASEAGRILRPGGEAGSCPEGAASMRPSGMLEGGAWVWPSSESAKGTSSTPRSHASAAEEAGVKEHAT